jgi:DNA helicase HerA-like ATPase
LIRRHFAVLGSTGVGKTTSVSLLLKKSLAMRPKLRIIIFDPHNEYAAHFPGLAQIIDSESLELPFWMFRFDELADVVFSGRQPHADERDALYEVIRVARAKYVAELGSSPGASAVRRQPVAEGSSVSADTPTPYRIADVVAVIEEWLGMLDQRFPRSDLRALRYRLEGLNRDPRYRFIFGRLVVEDDIAKVVSRLFRIPTRGLPVTIVRLAGLPNEVTNSVVSVLARLAFEIAFWCSGVYEINVLCEEAHRYISSDKGRPSARPGKRSGGSQRRVGNTAHRLASSHSGPRNSIRRCCLNVPRCSPCGSPMSSTRGSFAPRRGFRPAAPSPSYPRSPTARRSRSGGRSPRRCE